MDFIRIRGARTHNLKNVNLDLPRNRLVVITGLSGSGKSSLAFDTLYAEGQRRYVESLSTYARQFLELMEKPDVDLIEGLSPAIAIEQKAASHNPRSTVGTTICACCSPEPESRIVPITATCYRHKLSPRWWIMCWHCPRTRG
jgi:excinuclease ABC subunit A